MKHFLKGLNIVLMILVFLLPGCSPNTKLPQNGKEGPAELLTFIFETKYNSRLKQDCAGQLSLSGDEIEVDLVGLDDVTELVATFTYTGKSVTVNGRPQISGETSNDFEREVVYTITGSDGEIREYTVLVYLSDSGPQSRRPPIPAPKTYAGAVPNRSRVVLVERKPIETMDFSPPLTKAFITMKLFDGSGQEIASTRFPLEGTLLEDYLKEFGEFKLLEDGKLSSREELSFSFPDEGKTRVFTLDPLQTTPHIQLIRYWELEDPVNNVVTMDPGTTKTIRISTTVGTEASTTENFSVTVGVELGFDAGAVSGSINTEFGYNHTTALTERFEETREVTETRTAPDDAHVIVAMWRLVNEIKIVDETGETYTDPNYTFAGSLGVPLKFVNPTDYRVKSYQFKNH